MQLTDIEEIVYVHVHVHECIHVHVNTVYTQHLPSLELERYKVRINFSLCYLEVKPQVGLWKELF